MNRGRPGPTCATCVWFERDLGYPIPKTGECRYDDKETPGEPVDEEDWCEMHSLNTLTENSQI